MACTRTPWLPPSGRSRAGLCTCCTTHPRPIHCGAASTAPLSQPPSSGPAPGRLAAARRCTLLLRISCIQQGCCWLERKDTPEGMCAHTWMTLKAAYTPTARPQNSVVLCTFCQGRCTVAGASEGGCWMMAIVASSDRSMATAKLFCLLNRSSQTPLWNAVITDARHLSGHYCVGAFGLINSGQVPRV